MRVHVNMFRFATLRARASELKTDMRRAAFVVALERIATAMGYGTTDVAV